MRIYSLGAGQVSGGVGAGALSSSKKDSWGHMLIVPGLTHSTRQLDHPCHIPATYHATHHTVGDWLQGPYVYALYEFYGFTVKDIGRLFIAGFGSSMVFGTVVGSMADK